MSLYWRRLGVESGTYFAIVFIARPSLALFNVHIPWKLIAGAILAAFVVGAFYTQLDAAVSKASPSVGSGEP